MVRLEKCQIFYGALYFAKKSSGWPKLLNIEFPYMKNLLSLKFIQFHTYKELYEISIFSINKKIDFSFRNLISEELWVVFVTERK